MYWPQFGTRKARLGKGLGKDDFDFNAWASEFYTSLQCEAFAKIEPVISSFARVIDSPKDHLKIALVVLNTTLEVEFEVAKLHIDKGYTGMSPKAIIEILEMMEGKSNE
jgi:hypothetical protein